MLEYYRVFAKQIKLLPPQLSDFYHPSEGQKMVDCFVTVGTGLATYDIYKYLK